jgi:hypothetical protein
MSDEAPIPPEQPQQSSGEANPKGTTGSGEIELPSQSQEEPPESLEEYNQAGWKKWANRGKRAFVWAWKLFAEFVTVLWLLALWDSYRPKITVTPGPTLNTKSPFATMFIVQNQGALSIRNVSFDCTWTYADDPNQTRNVETGISLIPELKSFEQSILAAPFQFNIPAITDKPITNQLPSAVQTTPMPIAHHSLVMWFDVTYAPKYFGKRTETLYFFGAWDNDTNFQWFPTGNGDIRTEIYDQKLLKRSQDLAQTLQRQLASASTNNMPQPTNSSRTNGSPTGSATGGAVVHTN